MKRHVGLLLQIFCGLLLIVLRASAHHSFAAEFDDKQPVKLDGTVVKFEFMNPHSWIHLDVKSPDGKMVRWAVETGSTNALFRRGWLKDSLRAGDHIVVDAFRARHPSTPVIGFPKGAGGKLRAYAAETRVDAIGLDETVDPHWAARELPPGLPVQGNLDPFALIAGGEALKAAAERILDAFAARPHIFNLGHGIQQTTPIAHVEELVRLVKG